MDRQYYKGIRSVFSSYSQSNPTETNSSSWIGQRVKNYSKVEPFSSTPPYNSKTQKGNDRISEDEHLKSLECSSVYGNNQSGSYQMSWIYGLVNNIDKTSSSQSKLQSKTKQKENSSAYPAYQEQNKIISPILQNKPKIDEFSNHHRQSKHPIESSNTTSKINHASKYTYSQTNTSPNPLRENYHNYRDRSTSYKRTDLQHNTKFNKYQKEQHRRLSHYQKERYSNTDTFESNKLLAPKEYDKKNRSTTIGAYSTKRYSYCCLQGKQQFDAKECKDNAANEYKYSDGKEEYKDKKLKADYGINQNDSIGRIKRRNRENTQMNYSQKYVKQSNGQVSQQQKMLLEKYSKPAQIESYGYTRKYASKPQQPQQQQQIKINEMAQKLNKVLQNINHKSTIIKDSKAFAKESYDRKIRSMSYYEKSDKPLSIYDSINNEKCSPKPASVEKNNQRRLWEKDGTSDNKSKYRLQQQESAEHRKYSQYQQYPISDFDRKEHCRDNEVGKSGKSKNQLNKEKKKKQTLIQSMKKSIGKHLPNEIIIEQSSSQFGSSQFSEEPRCNSKSTFRSEALRYHQNKTQQEDYRNIQESFMKLYHSLDKGKLGYLNQRNYDESKISSQLKYLLGGILTPIRYNPEKVYMKDFLKSCEALWVDLGSIQKDQLLKMIENVANNCSNKLNTHFRQSSNPSLDKNEFKINIKDIKREKSSHYYCPRITIREVDDSHVIPTHINRDYGSEVQYYQSKSSQSSKRSSQFSQVVKKYEFNSQSEFTPREHQSNTAKNNNKGKDLMEPTYSESKELSAYRNNRSNRRNFSELYDNLNKKLNKYISTVTTTHKGQQINSCASMGNSCMTQKQNFCSVQLPKQSKHQYSSLQTKPKSIPQIPLSFEQLSKHYWETKRS